MTARTMERRHAARRRIANMWFVYLHRCDTRMCRKLLASPPGAYRTMALKAPNFLSATAQWENLVNELREQGIDPVAAHGRTAP